LKQWHSHLVKDSIIEFESFIEREILQNCEVFQLLKHYVKGYHFTLLTKHADECVGKTWLQIRKPLVALLDPKTMEEHEEDL
jgi:hypothetical protein